MRINKNDNGQVNSDEEKLYDAITNIDDSFIEEAKNHKWKQKRNTWIKFLATAASFILVFYVGGSIWFNGGLGGTSDGGGSGNHENGTTFMSYAGPIFPLTSIDDTEGIIVERNVDFDFSPYEGYERSYEDNDGNIETYLNYENESIITDTYTITNTTDEDMSITLNYPVVGTIGDVNEILPTITSNGDEIESVLYYGEIIDAYDWEEYKENVNEEYLNNIYKDMIELDAEVTVYKLSNASVMEGEGVAPHIGMEVDMDEHIVYYVYGFSGYSWNQESNSGIYSYSISNSGENDESSYFIVVGGELESYSIEGYTDGGCEMGDELESISVDVEVYTTTLGEILEQLVLEYKEAYLEARDGDEINVGDYILSDCSSQDLYSMLVEILLDYGLLGNEPLLDEFLYYLTGQKRVIYSEFEVTVPAGESIEIALEMVKQGSYDYYGTGKNNVDLVGYDMVTALESSLEFVTQTASIQNYEYIEIVNQNFGFDLLNGITCVELNAEEERYYIEIQRVEE